MDSDKTEEAGKRYIVYLEVDVSVDASSTSAAEKLAKNYIEVIPKIPLIVVDDVRVSFSETRVIRPRNHHKIITRGMKKRLYG